MRDCGSFSSFVIAMSGGRKLEKEWIRGWEGDLEDELIRSEIGLVAVSVTLRPCFFFTFMWPCIVTNFFLIKRTDALIPHIYFVKKLYYMFRAVPLPVVRSFPLYIRHWYMPCRFDDSFQARPQKVVKLMEGIIIIIIIIQTSSVQWVFINWLAVQHNSIV